MALLLPTSKTPTTIVQTNRIKESIKLHNETFSFSKIYLENTGKVPEQFSMEKEVMKCFHTSLKYFHDLLSCILLPNKKKGMRGGQVFQYKWNLGLTANAHHVSPTSAWSSAQLYREEQENYHQLWFRQILHDGWKPISCLLPCWWCKRKKYFLLLFLPFCTSW